jgi:hypothetical protein
LDDQISVHAHQPVRYGNDPAELRPKYYVKGKDWDGRLPPEQVRICAEHGIGVVYLDTVLDSSSRILDQFLSSKQSTR